MGSTSGVTVGSTMNVINKDATDTVEYNNKADKLKNGLENKLCDRDSVRID